VKGKLKINRQTVRFLASLDLARAAAGAEAYTNATRCAECFPPPLMAK